MKRIKKVILIALTLVLALSSVTLSFGSSVKAADDQTDQNATTTPKAGPTVFVTPKWTNKVINNKTKVKNYKVFEASYGNDSTFKKGHIPGAMHINTNSVESEANQWNLLSAKQIQKMLLKHGVTSKTTLIVYSTDVNAACRVAFAAFWVGVNKIKVVDGGYNAWTKANYKVQKGTEKKAIAATNFGTKVPANAKYEIKTPADFKKQQKADPNVILASTRSWKEFTGKISGYSYIKDKCEPKGAVYAKSSKTSSDVAYLLHKDGTVKTAAEIAPTWKEWGITPESNIDFYCGTGWRATTAFFIAYQAGWQNVHVFDGGWYAWDKAHKKNPSKYQVQVGDPRSKNVKILK
ncbi:sulfurtransferase [Companilactobacillus sp.]|jgi:thiosulfate/3-mercaptopyruvate sulfurtransferase|uniref:sulfurtransferase n=1 Tax=Companilactobacillus sp. TaxID=2767905 RepID=UPI0025B965F5|nr:rhodanese-like domain-containing protein [Companilactobacillus sp.]MCH4008427.1 sulfurtransferase [Companilactobacillus sp.]MCH4051394.1 sulfurtransferase [Companilactobacillus sp.]MCH4076370.1 sulfurtransferase [Companilactobacillus sp.]MCH4124945.1 sulfurtransferase [Companilactobacillus sp.]MCH4131487.1 sulfurtransferase [Companilactobacillus sp.]